MPEINYRIRLVDSSGAALAGTEVSVHYPWTNESDITDDDGWVRFRKDNISYGGVEVSVYADGQLLGEAWVEDGETLSYTI